MRLKFLTAMLLIAAPLHGQMRTKAIGSLTVGGATIRVDAHPASISLFAIQGLNRVRVSDGVNGSATWVSSVRELIAGKPNVPSGVWDRYPSLELGNGEEARIVWEVSSTGSRYWISVMDETRVHHVFVRATRAQVDQLLALVERASKEADKLPPD